VQKPLQGNPIQHNIKYKSLKKTPGATTDAVLSVTFVIDLNMLCC